MRRQYWALLLIAATNFATNPGLTQSLPRACLDWHKDPGGPLPRMDVDKVIYRSVLFKRTGNNYDVETFSDTSPVGSEHCYRWEIVNVSKSPNPIVDELSWPAAGIRVSRMRPGDENRDYNTKREQIPPGRQDNLVYAFENEKAPTQSWIASVQEAANKPPAGGGFSLRQTGELLPGLKDADGSILNRLIGVLSLGRDRPAAPPISQVVGYGDLSIRIDSRAVIEGRTLLISVDAQISNPPNEASFNFPALTALKQTEPKSVGDLGEAQRFLATFRETIKYRERFRPEWNFRFPVAVGNDGNTSVFRVLQPVIVYAGEGRHCYLTASYSPVPIGLSLQNCW